MTDPLDEIELYIMIRDGQPFQHPILKENLLQAFPSIDLNNLPEEFAVFKRGVSQTLDPYDKAVGTEYVYEDGIVYEKFIIEPMTIEEKIEKQITVKLLWKLQNKDNQEMLDTWIFNEETCQYEPPPEQNNE
jgi:hypothetical protein